FRRQAERSPLDELIVNRTVDRFIRFMAGDCLGVHRSFRTNAVVDVHPSSVWAFTHTCETPPWLISAAKSLALSQPVSHRTHQPRPFRCDSFGETRGRRNDEPLLILTPPVRHGGHVVVQVRPVK